VRTDLFGEEVFFEDPSLLDQLVTQKLVAIKEELLAEGWGWVETALEYDYHAVSNCSRLRATPVDPPAELVAAMEAAEAELAEAEKALEADEDETPELHDRCDAAEEKLASVKEQISGFVRFDPKKMSAAGCYVCVKHDGAARIERGLVRKQDEKKAKGKQDKTASNDEKGADLSNALLQDLGVYRLQVAQVALSQNPALAYDLLVFRAASDALGAHGAYDGPSVRFEGCYAKPSVEGETAAGKAFEEIFSGLPRKWLKPESEAKRFELFQKLAAEEKAAILAYCVANTLQPRTLRPETGEPSAYEATLAQTGVDVADHWRPTEEGFFSRLTRTQLLSIGEELFSPSWAKARETNKKTELVKELAQAFAEPDRYGNGSDRIRAWLPPGMSFGTVAKKTAPKRKGKKAA
jgi:ParB family chromosome partitioning protein